MSIRPTTSKSGDSWMDSKDKLVLIKASQRKTPLLLRMVVLLIAAVLGIYICYVCLNQISPAAFEMSILRLHQPIQSQPLPPNPVVVPWEYHAPIVVDSKNPVSLQVGEGGVQVRPPLIVNTTEQRSIRERIELLNYQVLERTVPLCNLSGIEPWEVPYIHFPKPIYYSREECACNPVHYFVVVSLQRSGSRWLETLLNDHANVTSYGEIFIEESRKENVSVILQTMDKLYNLDWSRRASKRECSAAVGFKWMLNQGLMDYPEEIMDYFKKKGVSVIFLFRRNMLRRMISRVANKYSEDVKLSNGKPKAHTHIPEEARLLAKYKPTIGPKRLIAKLNEEEEKIKRAVRYFNSTRHIVVYYEDLVQNTTKLTEVQKFLRLPYKELQSHEIKIHTGPMSEQIANWDKVQKALTGSKYEYLLHSDYQTSS